MNPLPRVAHFGFNFFFCFYPFLCFLFVLMAQNSVRQHLFEVYFAYVYFCLRNVIPLCIMSFFSVCCSVNCRIGMRNFFSMGNLKKYTAFLFLSREIHNLPQYNNKRNYLSHTLLIPPQTWLKKKLNASH